MSIPKSNLSKMTDTKWHIGYVTKEEDDPRRDKRKCLYYEKENNRCKLDGMTCVGSSHCPQYKT